MSAGDRKRILIFGCGWLGKKLGVQLINEGYAVYGTTRSKGKAEELEGLGIQPILLDLSVNDLSEEQIPEVDGIVISISPGRKEGRKDYPEVLSKIGSHYMDSGIQTIMYSSTSVYGSATGEVREDTEPADTANIIMIAERTLTQYVPEAVILRLCGLYGEDRHPIYSLADRKDIPNGDAPVNLVHSDDVIAVTKAALEQSIMNKIFNVCGDEHPTRANYYSTMANKLDVSKPSFLPGGGEGKVIVSSTVKTELGVSLNQSRFS